MISHNTRKKEKQKKQNAVTDPGFPVGGGTDPLGAPTSDMGVFQQKHMQKLKNWARW